MPKKVKKKKKIPIKKAQKPKKRSVSKKVRAQLPKHPWRVCPAGQHYRSGGPVSGYTTKAGKVVGPYSKDWTCADNPSGRDQLYPEEIHKIAQDHFEVFKSHPLKTIAKFQNSGNAFDHLIQGWTQYWNEILKTSDPLDPDLIKALIASESSFNPNAWNGKKGPNRARGLMQVLDRSVQYLKDDFPELHNHFINLTEDDMLDPNLSICAGIRWLFRKKQLAEAIRKRPLTWREAVIEYKGLDIVKKKRDRDLIARFDRYFSELKAKK